MFYHFLGVLKLAFHSWVTPKSKEKKSHRVVPQIRRLQVIGKSIFSTHLQNPVSNGTSMRLLFRHKLVNPGLVHVCDGMEQDCPETGEAATRGKWQAADASQPQRKKGLYRARAPDRRGYALGPARDRDREKAK